MLYLRWWEGLLGAGADKAGSCIVNGRLYDDGHGWWDIGIDLVHLRHKRWDGSRRWSVCSQVIGVGIRRQYGPELRGRVTHLGCCEGSN